MLFSIVAVPVYIPTNCVKGFLFSTSSPNICCAPSDDNHADRCEFDSSL